MIFKSFKQIFAALSLTLLLQFLCLQKAESKQIIVKYKNSNQAQRIISFEGGSFSQKPLFQNILGTYKKDNKNLSSVQQNSINQLSKYYILNFSESLNIDSALTILQSDASIESAEINHTFKVNKLDFSEPNDEFFDKQWGLKAVNCIEAWKKASGLGVKVGVVDTGIDYLHPDLREQLWINSKEDLNGNGQFDDWDYRELRNGVSGDLNGIDDDGNGIVDDVIGYDFVDIKSASVGDYYERDPIPFDEMGHGTLVSGVIAAKTNNEIGISGIAYNSKIITLRAFDATGNAETDDIASAIVYAALNSVKVLNFSFGDNIDSPLLHEAIKFAYSMDCIMVASKGNNGWDLPHFPSDYDEVIAVGSSTQSNNRDVRSNYGSNLSMLAPGANIFTCDLNSSYKYASGTSLAAPFVSAAAALLLELDSSLTPKDIKGILEATAKDVHRAGWDVETGAGILDIGKAVNNIAKTDISIISPQNFSAFNKDSITEFKVIGSVLIPMFESWQVLLGKSINPKQWDSLTVNSLAVKNKQQERNSILCSVNLENLADTTYTLQVLVNLKNGKSIQKRIIFSVFSQNSELEIRHLKKIMVWDKGRLTPSINILTNYSVTAKLVLFNGTDSSVYSSNAYLNSAHTFLLKDEQSFSGKAALEIKRDDGKTLRKEFELIFESQTAPTSSFDYISNVFPSSFLLNQVSDIYGTGNAAVIVNDMPYNYWQAAKIYEHKAGSFILKDSTDFPWIPVAIAKDSKGLPELLMKLSGRTALFKPNSLGENPFSNTSFLDTVSQNLWAAGLFDLNRNGENEIIAHSDSSFHIFSKIDSEYRLIASTPAPGNRKLIGTSPGFAVGDIEGDGIFELCHSNPSGNIFLYQFINDRLVLKFQDSLNYSNSSQNILFSDIDNDGIKEILVLGYGSASLFEVESEGNAVWSLRIYKKISNTFELIHTEYFNEVKSGASSSGISFRNGLSAGDVDGDGVDEIIVSTFPNFYVFKWDAELSGLKPIWYYPNALSNSAIIYDFNQNGINEICFSSFNNTLCFEYNQNSKSPAVPLDLDGWANKGAEIFLKWKGANDAEYYEIFQVVEIDSDYELVLKGTSDTTFFNLEAEANSEFLFVVCAFNKNFPVQRSKHSNLVQISTFPQIEALSISPADTNSLLIKFSGKLPTELIENSIFRLNENKENLIPQQVILANDSCYLLAFQSKLPSGKNEIKVSSFRDFYRNWTIENTLDFFLDEIPEQAKEMYLTKLELISNYCLNLEFSEEIESSSATNIENYSLKPNGAIEHISSSIDNPKAVSIYLSQAEAIGALGKTYYLTVKNLTSKDGIPITKGAGNCLSFIFSAEDLDNCFIYPNPIRYSEANDIFFGNITKEARINIYNFEGRLIKTLYTNEQTGGVYWNGLDESNEKLKPGIYLFNVIGLNESNRKIESSLKKFAIIQ